MRSTQITAYHRRLCSILLGTIACGTPSAGDPRDDDEHGHGSTGVAADDSATTSSDDTDAGDSSSGSGTGSSDGGDSTSTGSGAHECPPSPLAFDRFPAEGDWSADDGTAGLAVTLGSGAAVLALWLVEGNDPFADGVTVGDVDLSDASLRTGAGLTLSEELGEEQFRVYLPVKGTLRLEVVEEPADGSRLAGRIVDVAVREYDEQGKAPVDGGCRVELEDAAFDVTLVGIGSGSGGPTPE